VNIDSVSLSDAWGVRKPWVKIYKKRYGDLFTSVRVYPSAKALKCNSVTGEGILMEIGS
jgi:hypothetical protein